MYEIRDMNAKSGQLDPMHFWQEFHCISQCTRRNGSIESDNLPNTNPSKIKIYSGKNLFFDFSG